jgi:tRNA1Val (adenine37-N6)-methyltransferase
MFRFKQFSIHQDRCAMKVGTDGVLLGAWAQGGQRILDIGTGTGLIALMMAQRYPEAEVTGIDIDQEAVQQAQENIVQSPFKDRVEAVHSSLQDYTSLASSFNSIVSNPPFFVDSLPAPDRQRTIARHTNTLTYRDLMQSAYQLLSDEGELSLIIPFDYRRRLDDEAIIMGFFPCRVCAVRTTDSKPPRRYLLAYRKHPCPCQQESLTIGSDSYRILTQPFYL